MELAERTERSVAWLNRLLPHWRTIIDTSILDMSHPQYCILGQLELWSAFMSNEDRYFSEEEGIVDHAFDTFDGDVSYEGLRTAWMEVLLGSSF